MTDELAGIIAKLVKQVFGLEKRIILTRTSEKFGDFSTNIAMQLSGEVNKHPEEIANLIIEDLRPQADISDANVAGPGFINLKVSDDFLSRFLVPKPQNEINQTVLLEYSCPNAFKELHTGHLYQTLIGDAMSRIYEHQGYKVYRTSFGGDVGLHAAKCMWGILKALGGEKPEGLESQTNRPAWIAEAYVNGSSAYENDEVAKSEIDTLNKRIYEMVGSGDQESDFARIFYTARQWSYDYFDLFYKEIGAETFDKYYPESETLEPGLKIVEANKGTVFTESQGAVVLDESKSGLHTRVFITSNGLPTYETKDLGVINLESQEFPYDKRVILTGNDQTEYMQVVFAALKLIDPELGAKQNHVANGTVKFADGTKMSSRLGNVTKATEVLGTVIESVEAKNDDLKKQISLAAVKYSLLKSRVGGDIAFDIEQSISTEGNSGPYLQYALVRARSILGRTGSVSADSTKHFDEYERSLALKLSEFPEVLDQTIFDYSPHHLCTYLYELAQTFNRFYENARVIDDPRSPGRLFLVQAYQDTLSSGMELLGIPTPQEM